VYHNSRYLKSRAYDIYLTSVVSLITASRDGLDLLQGTTCRPLTQRCAKAPSSDGTVRASRVRVSECLYIEKPCQLPAARSFFEQRGVRSRFVCRAYIQH